jgi:hypothetical protein
MHRASASPDIMTKVHECHAEKLMMRVVTRRLEKVVVKPYGIGPRDGCHDEEYGIWNSVLLYEGESNENRKTEIKIRNIAPLSYKLADMLPML